MIFQVWVGCDGKRLGGETISGHINTSTSYAAVCTTSIKWGPGHAPQRGREWCGYMVGGIAMRALRGVVRWAVLVASRLAAAGRPFAEPLTEECAQSVVQHRFDGATAARIRAIVSAGCLGGL